MMMLHISINLSKIATNRECTSEYRLKSKDFTLYKSIKLPRDHLRISDRVVIATQVHMSI